MTARPALVAALLAAAAASGPRDAAAGPSGGRPPTAVSAVVPPAPAPPAGGSPARRLRALAAASPRDPRPWILLAELSARSGRPRAAAATLAREAWPRARRAARAAGPDALARPELRALALAVTAGLDLDTARRVVTAPAAPGLAVAFLLAPWLVLAPLLRRTARARGAAAALIRTAAAATAVGQAQLVAPLVAAALAGADWTTYLLGPASPEAARLAALAGALGSLGLLAAALGPLGFRPRPPGRADLRAGARLTVGLFAWLALWAAARGFWSAARGAPFAPVDPGTAAWMRGLGLAGAAVMVAAAPLAEELFFRGWLLGTCRRRVGARGAIALSAAAFAAAHPADPVGHFGAGVLLGRGAVTRRGVWPGVVAHAAWNAFAFAVGSASSGG